MNVVRSISSTASYCSVLDPSGEVRLGMGDMAAHTHIDRRMVEETFEDFRQKSPSPSLIVFDGNLSVDAMDAILGSARADEGVRGPAVLFEPTNMLKTHLPFQTTNYDVITHTSPNYAELQAMKHFVQYGHPLKSQELEQPGTLEELLERAVSDCKFVFSRTKLKMMIVTLAEHGVLISEEGGSKFKHYQVWPLTRFLSVLICRKIIESFTWRYFFSRHGTL